MSPISKRLDGVSESATLKLNSMVQAMRASGVDVVNLTAGEPDFNVPEEAKQAVIEALNSNKSKYTPVGGIPELRKLVAEKTNRQQPSLAKLRAWTPEDVIVTNGGKQALINAFFALLDSGDEVIIPSPFWLSYPEMVKLAGGTPRLVRSSFESGFKMTPAQLREAILEGRGRVKMVVLNSPSNPTGVMYSRAELAALGQVLVDLPEASRVWVISDEIYDRITFGQIEFCSFGDACPALRERMITVNGMSKSAAMTGWRIGWTVAPKVVTQAMLTLQGQSTSGINALAQWASVAALKMPESAFSSQVESFRKRRDLTLEILGKAGKLKIVAPQGAFYVFVGVGNYLKPDSSKDSNGAKEDSLAFAERLLEGAKVAVVPGTPFGESEFFRISFALDEKSLRTGCQRIVDFLSG